ncbi:hypothetical protein ACFL6O_05230 [candidate division KSB1 bacterium]
MLKTITSILFILINTSAVFAQENEVLELVRDVRERAKETYNNIGSLAFSGHSEIYFYIGSKIINLHTVGNYEDCYFNGYWKKPDSLQIVVKGFRTVDPEAPNRQSFWDDTPLPDPVHYSFFNTITHLGHTKITTVDPVTGMNKRVGLESFWPIFPFADGADSLYNYEIISEIGMNSRRIIELRVSTISDETPGVSGVFHIDADEKDIVGSDYTFNEAGDLMQKFVIAENLPSFARILVDFDTSYRVHTKKVLVNGVYWLPEKIVEDVNIKTLGSRISFQRELDFTSYFINMKPEDTPLDLEVNTYPKDTVIFRRDPVLERRVFSTMEDSTKLTKEEENRIICSIENKFIQMDNNRKKKSFEQKGRDLLDIAKGFGSNIFLHNRVEGVRLFYNIGFTGFLSKNSSVNIEGGYGTQDKRWKGKLSYQKYFGKKRKLLLEGRIYDNLDHNEGETGMPTVVNTYSSLFFKLDHRDYYYTTGANISLGYEFKDNLIFKLTGISQKEQGAGNHSDFAVFNWSGQSRLNPDIQNGKFNGFRSSLMFRNYNTTFNLAAEYSGKKTLNSDFEYKTLRSDLMYIYEPNYSGKFILSLYGAVSSGTLPPQRWFDFGGKTLLEYYGNLRGVGYNAFTGDRMAAGILEYSFCYGDMWDAGKNATLSSIALKMTRFTFWTGLGWSALSEHNLILAAGKNIPVLTANGKYHEFGISIGDRFNLIRFDFITNNTSDKSVLFSFNFWR